MSQTSNSLEQQLAELRRQQEIAAEIHRAECRNELREILTRNAGQRMSDADLLRADALVQESGIKPGNLDVLARLAAEAAEAVPDAANMPQASANAAAFHYGGVTERLADIVEEARRKLRRTQSRSAQAGGRCSQFTAGDGPKPERHVVKSADEAVDAIESALACYFKLWESHIDKASIAGGAALSEFTAKQRFDALFS